jgi:hypothetical protein
MGRSGSDRKCLGMDLLKGLGLSGESGRGSRKHSGLGNDPRRLLRKRSGKSRCARDFMSA